MAILEAMTHMAEDALHEPEHGYGEDVIPYEEGRFLTAIEAQDEAGALARLRGGLDQGMSTCWGRSCCKRVRFW